LPSRDITPQSHRSKTRFHRHILARHSSSFCKTSKGQDQLSSWQHALFRNWMVVSGGNDPPTSPGDGSTPELVLEYRRSLGNSSISPGTSIAFHGALRGTRHAPLPRPRSWPETRWDSATSCSSQNNPAEGFHLAEDASPHIERSVPHSQRSRVKCMHDTQRYWLSKALRITYVRKV
jgi:hypothetical protein